MVSNTVVFNTTTVRRPSFRDVISGARMAFWLSGNTRGQFHFDESAMEADCAAINNDWASVRQDFLEVLDDSLRQHRRHGIDDRCCL